MANLTEIQNMIDTLLAAYPRFEPKDLTAFARVWSKALGKYSAPTLERAVDNWLRAGSEWFPNLPEIVKLCEKADFAPPASDNNLYWQAMDVFNASLAGEVTDKDLETDKAWKWFKRRQKANGLDPARCAKCKQPIERSYGDGAPACKACAEKGRTFTDAWMGLMGEGR
jgi:hypothetical protein